jgi:hypothetical protein
MTIKAIETVYNGYRFRSRLEARWAVFFDALEIEYQYEPEGYDLRKQGWYLPDFWLPHSVDELAKEGWGLWVEIKPIELNTSEKEKIYELCRLTGHNVLSIEGSPYKDEHRITKWRYMGRHDKNKHWCDIVLKNGQFKETICETGLSKSIQIIGSNFVNPSQIAVSYPMIFAGYRMDGLENAFTIARQARFEHGEIPVIQK